MATDTTNIMDHQKKILYMFERLSEPLYLGPRGQSNIYFDIPLQDVDAKVQRVSAMVRDMLAKQNMGASEMLTIEKPATALDLSRIGQGCKRSEIFSWFIPSHQRAAAELKKIFMDAPDRESYINTAITCRDHPMINSGLFYYAAISSGLSRPDMRGLRFPALWEVMPDIFVPPSVRNIAIRQVAIPTKERSVIKMNGSIKTAQKQGRQVDVTINASFTGRNNNPENKLWYFREDIGVASHHWHWHAVYGDAPYEGEGAKDRKGELFYYMHHSMLSRYEAERLANGLERTRILDLATRPVIDEGYFGKLVNENSGKMWGTRQERTQVQDVHREHDVEIEDLRKWKDRIFEAIDTGFIIKRDGKRLALRSDAVTTTIEDIGTNILGNIVQNGGPNSLNPQFYGNLHNMGHVIIGFSHDPVRRHNESNGPMAHEATAMKDPAFYRWHKFIDRVFDNFKQTLPPYTEDQLAWPGIEVKEIKVTTPSRDPNALYTHWMESDVDLTRGLDLERTSSMQQGPVWARITHLNHEDFLYEIKVENSAGRSEYATVRIFIAPRLDEQGESLNFAQQRLLFFEQDKFLVKLTPGQNRIVRKSSQSNVTIPWESSFRDLEQIIQSNDGKMLRPQDAVCGCGWPQHLLVPRGTPDGMEFDLFVMLTDGRQDTVKEPSTNAKLPCKESLSYCGILDAKYPDTKPMGFPFDRKQRESISKGMNMDGGPTLADFIGQIRNMASTTIRIFYEPQRVEIRGNGAPADMDVMEPLDAVSKDSTAISFGSKSARVGRPQNARPARQDSWAYDSSPERFSDD